MSRVTTRSVARLLVLAVLASQLVVSAYACPAMTASTAGGVDAVVLAVEAETSAAMPCDGANAIPDSAPSVLCMEHCKVGQQTDGSAPLGVSTAISTLLYPLPPFEYLGGPSRPSRRSETSLVSAFPPYAILHCVMRT